MSKNKQHSTLLSEIMAMLIIINNQEYDSDLLKAINLIAKVENKRYLKENI